MWKNIKDKINVKHIRYYIWVAMYYIWRCMLFILFWMLISKINEGKISKKDFLLSIINIFIYFVVSVLYKKYANILKKNWKKMKMTGLTKKDIEKFNSNEDTILDVYWDNKYGYTQDIVGVPIINDGGNIVGYIYYVDNDYIRGKVDVSLVPEIAVDNHRMISF